MVLYFFSNHCLWYALQINNMIDYIWPSYTHFVFSFMRVLALLHPVHSLSTTECISCSLRNHHKRVLHAFHKQLTHWRVSTVCSSLLCLLLVAVTLAKASLNGVKGFLIYAAILLFYMQMLATLEVLQLVSFISAVTWTCLRRWEGGKRWEQNESVSL